MTTRSLLPLMLLAVAACDDKVITSNTPPPGNAPVAVAPSASATPVLPPRPPIDEAEFIESDLSRDPFRSYAKSFVQVASNGPKPDERAILFRDYTLDEVKLIGIVTRATPAQAMLVDPSGKGWVVKRGQLVGRPDVVQGGGGTSTYEINWRVDRIRDGDVVFVREDPQNRDVPTITRIVPLHPPEPEASRR